MTLVHTRNCPLCGAAAKSEAFPYATRFNDVDFKYLKCAGCASVYVDPVPDDHTFSLMYARDVYHDCHYDEIDNSAYTASAKLLRQYLSEGSCVLDYGCGVGVFLKSLQIEGFVSYGTEFDPDAAKLAGHNADCTVLSVADFKELANSPKFDAIHMGDVLEHLPDPAEVFIDLTKYLKPGGIIFVEGPLEINPSPVYWAAGFFGWIKHMLKPGFIAGHTPTHLFSTGEKQQFDFFSRTVPGLVLKHWKVYETGWPYINGGLIKNFIAHVSILLGSRKLLGMTFGNRFEAIFSVADSDETRTA